ncbi:MAG: hypothetical protein LQ348_005971 [Seirophora lacunosa]|nr:MAG: hypothetical protein LQ348_005971 [Seirophora lacunosa]
MGIRTVPVRSDLEVRCADLSHEKALGQTPPSSLSSQVSFDAEAKGKKDAKSEGLGREPHDSTQQGLPLRIDEGDIEGRKEIGMDITGGDAAGEHSDNYLRICEHKEGRNMKIQLRVRIDVAREGQARTSGTPSVGSSGITLICSHTDLWQASLSHTYIRSDNSRVLDPRNVNGKWKKLLNNCSDGRDVESALGKESITNRNTGNGKDSATFGSHSLKRSENDDGTHNKRQREDSCDHNHDIKRTKTIDNNHGSPPDAEVASSARPTTRLQMPCEHAKNSTMSPLPLHTIDHSPSWTPINCHCACVTTWPNL